MTLLSERYKWGEREKEEEEEEQGEDNSQSLGRLRWGRKGKKEIRKCNNETGIIS